MYMPIELVIEKRVNEVTIYRIVEDKAICYKAE